MLDSGRAGLVRRAGDIGAVAKTEIGLEADQAGRLRQGRPREAGDLVRLGPHVSEEATGVSLPITIRLVAVTHGLWAAQRRTVLVGDSGLGQRLTEGRLGEALLARQRQLPHVHNQLDASLLQTFDERLYGQAFVAESE